MQGYNLDTNLPKQVAALGAKDMDTCMQCGNCASACPLSQGENTFPRKIYRYLQLGQKKELLSAPEPWLCYYCGDCNTDCPRGAEPAETMMAARRWLTTQYDWTGLATKFYADPKWEVGAFLAIFLFVVSLFAVFHGPIVTERVELNTFAPAHWVHIGDEIMIVIVMALLFSNGFNMYRKIMAGTKIPLSLYLQKAPVFIINYFTQKKWRKCGTGPGSAWWRHLFLFSGWVAMEVLVMIFLTSFQTDIIHPFWHPTRIVGYYATVALLVGSGSMLYSRWYKKKENLHRYSDFTDQFFLILIFVIALTGILVHFARLGGLPLTTYAIYVFHVAICVAMLMIMLPFGKLSHLLYRPTAIFLTTLKADVQKAAAIDAAQARDIIGDKFDSCMQCGTCTASCPKPVVSNFSPRQILRNISLNRATDVNVESAAWQCATCDSCVAACPRGIPIADVMNIVREKGQGAGLTPPQVTDALKSLKDEKNPWPGQQRDRQKNLQNIGIKNIEETDHYCLYSCCASLKSGEEHPNTKGLDSLTKILKKAEINFGSLGKNETCCGDLARVSGQSDLFKQQQGELENNFSGQKVITNSPHCLTNINNSTTIDNSVNHSTELLAQLIDQQQIIPTIELDYTVTYHDPCYLGRKNEIYDAPRKILNSIPSLKFKEMQRNKQNSLCCGGGGGGVFQTETTLENSGIRIQEAIDTGADTLVTTCPYCIQMFEECICTMNLEQKIQVKDIATLLFESLSDSKNTLSQVDPLQHLEKTDG